MCMCEEITRSQGKNHPKGLGVRVPGPHTELVIVSVLTKPQDLWSVGLSLEKGLAPVVVGDQPSNKHIFGSDCQILKAGANTIK